MLLYDPEQFSYPKGRRTEYYCQFNLAIASPYDSEFPLVGRDVIYKVSLSNIINNVHIKSIFFHLQMLFPKTNTRQMLRFGNSTAFVTINNCEFELISWKTIFIPIIIILAISLAIMIVFWRFDFCLKFSFFVNKMFLDFKVRYCKMTKTIIEISLRPVWSISLEIRRPS